MTRIHFVITERGRRTPGTFKTFDDALAETRRAYFPIERRALSVRVERVVEG